MVRVNLNLNSIIPDGRSDDATHGTVLPSLHRAEANQCCVVIYECLARHSGFQYDTHHTVSL